MRHFELTLGEVLPQLLSWVPEGRGMGVSSLPVTQAAASLVSQTRLR